MSRLTFVQALIFTIFIVMAICGLWLGYIWQDGMLGPVETQEQINATSKQFGPWAILIDIFIFMPLTWWFARKYVWKEKIKGVLPGLLMDKTLPMLPPIPPEPPAPPFFIEPEYAPTNDDWMCDELRMRERK